jgi:hypothetical protein
LQEGFEHEVIGIDALDEVIATFQSSWPEGVEPLSWYFRRGQLKDALFAAQNATSPATRWWWWTLAGTYPSRR